MEERLSLRIARNGLLFLQGEEISIETFEQRLEEDKANGIKTLIVANVSEDPEWGAVQKPLELLARFGRTLNGVIETSR